VSAFLLDEKGKVLGDDWFVFYGQEQSPDGSVFFLADSAEDRENITIHFKKLNAKVQKIVFVLTINEAFEKRLNFSMLQEAYVRIIDHASKQELASFQMDAYYSNVTSMMIGEIYRHKKVWKFHAVGNGVARDLAGLCELYGVQVI
jgi:tellurium resistance protein TerD